MRDRERNRQREIWRLTETDVVYIKRSVPLESEVEQETYELLGMLDHRSQKAISYLNYRPTL